jgi:LytS/YehU family sensor histidine kinase
VTNAHDRDRTASLPADAGPSKQPLRVGQRPLRVAAIAHVTYWVFIGSTLALVQALDPKQAMAPRELLFLSGSWAGTSAVITAGAAWLARRLGVLAMAGRRRAAILTVIAIASYVLCVAAGSVASVIQDVPRHPDAVASQAYVTVAALLFWWLVHLAWVGLSLMSFYFFHAGRAHRSAREARALAHEAQLALLAYQINPHFLFNALNSITARIAEDAPSAQVMVRKLAELLRHSLGHAGQTGDVRDELARVQLYVDLERARFEANLVVETEVDETTLQLPVLPFLLQPLVENAIRHGMRTAPSPIVVRIRVGRADGDLTVVVSNQGTLEPARTAPGAAAGLGLANVRQRLELHHGDHHRFDLREEDGWVHAEIRIAAAQPETDP